METSERLMEILRFAKECQRINEIAREGISEESKREQDLLHAIEFEPKAKERSKICTQLHLCRKERRRYKDMFEITDPVVRFLAKKEVKRVFDEIPSVIGSVKKVEKYHAERVYNPRIKEDVE